MKTRIHYERLYENYPDVVTVSELQKMLGGIGESTARKIIRSNQIRHFYIHGTYFMPKTCVIDYILSPDYEAYKHQLKAQV